MEVGRAGSSVISRSDETAGEGCDQQAVWSTIEDVDRMPAFLMTLVTDSDLWMYLSSRGGLTCGRVQSDRALFPYETDDRLHLASEFTGGITLIRMECTGGEVLWRPLDPRGVADGARRSLSRTLLGDRVRFEEVHEGLGLRFVCEWALSDRFGAVRHCSLASTDGRSKAVELLDGLLNVMPAGVEATTQQAVSTLVDAYKRTEYDPDSALAIYALESKISDMAEPAESLRANIVWRLGLDGCDVCLDQSAVERYSRGEPVAPAFLLTGRSGCYLCHKRMTVKGDGSIEWTLCGDVHLDQAAVVRMREALRGGELTRDGVRESTAKCAARFKQMLAAADGRQLTADSASCHAHHSNVQFNCMRGGLFPGGYTINVQDFRAFVCSRNKRVAETALDAVSALRELEPLEAVREAVRSSGDAGLARLWYEYMPLTFGRRHGDPSRPWNRFEIRLRHEDGSRILDYQGNWRDIFQNWEALCRSYPAYLPHAIAKFVNASTADGFNPYRISRDGIDWEVPDPHDPWANIGYWGDHQIIYLLRLLEQLNQTAPAALGSMLFEDVFSYADVPYKIKPYAEIVRNSKSTIEFDETHHEAIRKRVATLGADGRLLIEGGDRVLHVNLVEKLLVPALAKLSNLVPDGGIWLNTQRPEWNDANNAIVGNGLSMVTLYYLRRYADFCVDLLEAHDSDEVQVSRQVAKWCDSILRVLLEHMEVFAGEASPDDQARRAFLDQVGEAFSAYRDVLYEDGPGERRGYPMRSITDLFRLARHYCDYAIRVVNPGRGLVHSYNILVLSEDPATARVSHLDLMLEGQVALLSAGVLDGERTAEIVEAMFESPLYRADVDTFVLYPIVNRPAFLDRNVIKGAMASPTRLVERLIETGQGGILQTDILGNVRFSCDFTSGDDLAAALERLGRDPEWAEDVHEHGRALLDTYESVFRHVEFTGRSGTMHKYEGIGCVYWHMVSKLLLAVQESYIEASQRGEDKETLARLARAYDRVRGGLGFNKTAREFGAFSYEPYSHTPLHAGAQQPGMTGQVKEGVLARFGELGIRLRDGAIAIEPSLLGRDELLDAPAKWSVERADGAVQTIEVPAGSLAFTYCGIPFVYTAGDSCGIEVSFADGRAEELHDSVLPHAIARRVFARSREIDVIRVRVDRSELFAG